MEGLASDDETSAQEAAEDDEKAADQKEEENGGERITRAHIYIMTQAYTFMSQSHILT